jgi:hypothetical protein
VSEFSEAHIFISDGQTFPQVHKLQKAIHTASSVIGKSERDFSPYSSSSSSFSISKEEMASASLLAVRPSTRDTGFFPIVLSDAFCASMIDSSFFKLVD